MIAHDGYPPILTAPVGDLGYEFYMPVYDKRKIVADMSSTKIYKTRRLAILAARRAWDRLMDMGAEMRKGDMV